MVFKSNESGPFFSRDLLVIEGVATLGFTSNMTGKITLHFHEGKLLRIQNDRTDSIDQLREFYATK